MECRISMIGRPAKTLIVLLICMLANRASAQRDVVLVTSESCAMSSISMLDVRKAYFGIATSFEGNRISAYRLNDDEMLGRIFYQSVVAMSEKSYERRLLSMLLKYGTPRPAEFSDVGRLATALRQSPCSISYMWGVTAKSLEGIKSIRLLWRGE